MPTKLTHLVFSSSSNLQSPSKPNPHSPNNLTHCSFPSMAHTRPDFNLPDEILSVIPADPYEQLDLARKLTSMAIASRVTNLESETDRLRSIVQEKDRRVLELQDKVTHLETACQDAELRFKLSREDNMKLEKERDSLALTVKRISRDLAKLETFKKQLMQSLNDENSPHKSETVDIGTYDHSVTKAYSKNGSYEELNGYQKSHSYSGSTDSANDDVSKHPGQRLPMTPYAAPRFTPKATPKVISASITPRYSVAATPQIASGATSPKNHYEGGGTLSSWYPSGQQSSAANSPPRRPLAAHTPRMDGKEFFRQARSRLSLEQFSAFLANIKELNAQRQSREETLRKAEEIFGFDNKDLYISFQGLINRNVH